MQNYNIKLCYFVKENHNKPYSFYKKAISLIESTEAAEIYAEKNTNLI